MRSKLEELAAPKKKGPDAKSGGTGRKDRGGLRGSRDASGPPAGPGGAPGRARRTQQGARDGAGGNAPHAGLRQLADHRRGHLRVDRDSGRKDADGRDPHGPRAQGPARAARHRPVARPRGDRKPDPHRPREPDGSAPAHRRLPPRRAERRRQDRDRPDARGGAVRRGAQPHHDQHERVPGGAHRLVAQGLAAGLRRLRRGGRPDRGGPAPSVFRRPPRRGREGAPRRHGALLPGLRQGDARGRRGARDRLQEHRHSPDVECRDRHHDEALRRSRRRRPSPRSSWRRSSRS